MSHPKYPIIGIAGKAKHGKNLALLFVLAAVGGYEYAFADPFKDMLRCLGIDFDDVYWQTHKEEVIGVLGVSPRHMMQTLGSDWGRKLIHPNIWVIFAAEKLQAVGSGMAIPDVRFENEAAWIRSKGGLIIHIHRSGVAPVLEHESEVGIEFKDGDIRILNDGTPEELQAKINEALKGF